jgi:type I restriction enzyme S subunit
MGAKPYQAYKDSGVEWIGEIPEHWDVKRLKDALTRNDGGCWGDDSSAESGTLVFRSTEQTMDGNWSITDPAYRHLRPREIQECTLQVGDLVMTKSSGSSSHIGKTTLVDKSIAELRPVYSNFMQRLRVSDCNFPTFHWYFLNNKIARIQFDFYSNTTTGLANLNEKIIGSVQLPSPPLEEQKLIASFLDRKTGKIDALVEQQQQLINLLKEKRQSLISHTVTKGLNPSVRMKDSGVEWIGAIPEHWEVKRLKDSLVRNDGGCWGMDPLYGQGTLVLRSTEQTVDGYWNIQDPAYRELSDREKGQCTLLLGDLVMTKSSGSSSHIGKTTIVDESVAALTPAYSNFMQRLRTSESLLPSLLWYTLNNQVARLQLDFYSNTTTGLANLNSKVIGSVLLPTPPLEDQKQIAAFLDQETSKIDQLIDKANQSIALLKERRSSLISAAVTGKIDVREAA